MDMIYLTYSDVVRGYFFLIERDEVFNKVFDKIVCDEIFHGIHYTKSPGISELSDLERL